MTRALGHTEDVYLLHDLRDIGALHHVLSSLHQNKFFTATKGYLLQKFINDVNMGDKEIRALVEKYSDPVTLATALLVPTGGTFSQVFIKSLNCWEPPIDIHAWRIQ
jgi:hypothetical protein